MPDKHEVGGSSPLGPTSRTKFYKMKVKNYKPFNYGGVAQLGEHLPCKQGVMGSNPIISTSYTTKYNRLKFLWLPFFLKKVTYLKKHAH